MTVYFLCIVLFCVGLYAVVTKKNLIKIIIGIGIMEYAVNLFIILVGYKHGAKFPIISKGDVGSGALNMVDPLTQALVLTAIVIGLATMALMVAVAIRLYEKYGTFDITEIKRLKG